MSLCNVPWSFLCFICICSAYALLDDKVKFFAARRLRSGTRSITCAKCSETPFLSSLLQVTPKLRHRFFFPGHSGVAPVAMNKLGSIQGLYRNDVPELEGTDNIHNPEGPLLHAQQLASKLYNARRTWFLVNGCSSGIMVAMLSCVRLHQMRSIPFEEKVHNSDARSIFIVGRDAHKSVFDALYLAQDCDAVLLPCPQDSTFHVSLGVTLESIKEAINVHGSKICGLLLTRPSYQGLMLNTLDMQAIVKLCHRHGIPVVVDEAHGAHLRFLESPIYQDALTCGADIAVQSTHKTLTSLSQTAMLHLGHDAFQYKLPKTLLHELKNAPTCTTTDDSFDVHINENERTLEQNTVPSAAVDVTQVETVVHSYFSMLTTTSPNSVLLASLDAARAQFEEHGAEMVQQAALAVNSLRAKLRAHGSPFINLLEDSLEVRRRGLVVDPLRLSLQYCADQTGNKSEDAPQIDSTHYDDILCEEHSIYCELNQPHCITYAIPPTTSVSAGNVVQGEEEEEEEGGSLQCLEKALLGLAAPVHAPQEEHQEDHQEEQQQRRQRATQKRSPQKETAAGAHPQSRPLPLLQQHSHLRYLHGGGGGGGKNKLFGAEEVPLLEGMKNESLVGRVSAETISVYPPGIPVLARGEVIQDSHLQVLARLHRSLAISTPNSSAKTNNAVAAGAGGGGFPSGTTVTGCTNATLGTILVYL